MHKTIGYLFLISFLCRLISNSSQYVLNYRVSSLLNGREVSIACTAHLFLSMHYKNLGLFRVFTTINNADIHFGLVFSCVSDMCLGVVLLGHMEFPFSRNLHKTWRETISICIPNTGPEFFFLHIFVSVCCFQYSLTQPLS